MYYFEANEPYYALGKADSAEDFMKIYKEVVLDIDDEQNFLATVAVVSEKYACVKHAQALKKDGSLVWAKEVLKQLDQNNVILVIDGCLS
jgi:hypothetical protein